MVSSSPKDAFLNSPEKRLNNSTTPSGKPASSNLLHGIWAAVPTPFDDSGTLDLPGVAANARRFSHDLGLEGIFCNGLIGELWSLTLDERKLILEAALAGAGNAMKVGVVVTTQNLTDTLVLAKHAARAGAHHIVLMRPAGLGQNEDIERYVRAVGASSDVPMVVFDGGTQTGALSADMLSRLADDGQIHGVKCTRGGDAAETLRTICGERISIVDPYESHWLSNLLRFDLRVLYADPEPYLFQLPNHRSIEAYFSAYKSGDLGVAAQLFRELEPIRSLYHRWIMAPLQNGRPVNAVLKRWFGYMGFAAGPARAPLAPLASDLAAQFDTELRAAFQSVYGAAFTFPAMDECAWKS
jgi:4-hydroxy-tetrahydrodipicolinate synthase